LNVIPLTAERISGLPLDVTGKYRYPPARAGWLLQHVEDIIDPKLPIIDAHHHIWEQEGNAYLLDDFASDLASGHRIDATVFVQAHYGYGDSGPEELRCVGETEKIARLVREARRRGIGTDVCAAIVCFADLLLADGAAAVIEAHLAAAPDLVRGVRDSVSRDPNFPDGIVIRPAPAGLLANTRYRTGMAKVAEYGLTYDAMLYHRQIPELTDAARTLPQLSIVLDHFGGIIGVGPYEGLERETFQSWRADMMELAKCPNVSVKLGGMGMIICGARWHERAQPPNSVELADRWRPYVETCIELFGAGRCMFESNFPVDKAMFSYAVLWNAYKRIAVNATADEKAALFHDTAARMYRIS
jgi:L-fuconolactonase